MTRQFVRVVAAEPIGACAVRVSFSSGETRDIDLQPFLHGEIFRAIREDAEVFRRLTVDPQLGTICRPNGADIDPDVLYLGLEPAWRERAGRAGEEGSAYPAG